jgi:hypothetical protein
LKSVPGIAGQVLLFVAAVVGGSILAAFLTFGWDFPRSLENFTPIILLGIAMTYAAFGAIAALFFAVPFIVLMRLFQLTRLPATAMLTVGGGLFGAGLMKMTFTGFEHLGATAGGSIGFALGILFFPPSYIPIQR